MATIADNIRSMAGLVADIKKDFKLTENTVLRIVDMNFALAQESGQPTFSGDEELPLPDPEFIEEDDNQMTLFPVGELITPEDESDDVLATTDHPLEN